MSAHIKSPTTATGAFARRSSQTMCRASRLPLSRPCATTHQLRTRSCVSPWRARAFCRFAKDKSCATPRIRQTRAQVVRGTLVFLPSLSHRLSNLRASILTFTVEFFRTQHQEKLCLHVFPQFVWQCFLCSVISNLQRKKKLMNVIFYILVVAPQRSDKSSDGRSV